MTDWIPIAQAARRAAKHGDINAGRQSVLQAISDGLLRARAYRSKTTRLNIDQSEDAEVEKKTKNAKWLVEIDLSWLKWDGSYGELEEFNEMNGLDAIIFIGVDDENWTIVHSREKFRSDVRTDWVHGRFHHCRLYYNTLRNYDLNSTVGYIYIEVQWFGVEVDAEAVERLLVPTFTPTDKFPPDEFSTVQWTTQYDWEAAFADVAAAFHWGESFENVSARGVQVKIIELLKQSFERRSLPMPGDTKLKEKARKIQGALRSFRE